MYSKVKLTLIVLFASYIISLATEAQTIGVSDNHLGSYLVDGAGMTLYYFNGDLSGDSSCYGHCMDNWISFYTDDVDLTSTKINAYDFTTIQREDDKLQTAYKGRPLYRYNGDQKPGDINGQGLINMWFIASL